MTLSSLKNKNPSRTQSGGMENGLKIYSSDHTGMNQFKKAAKSL
jgi:hypothetical protein